MVSRQPRRRGATDSQLRNSVRRLLASDPDATQAGVIRALRGEGLTFRDVRARAELEVQRTVLRAGGTATEAVITILREASEGRRPSFGILREQQLLRRAGIMPADERPGIGDRQYVRVNYRTQFRAIISEYGQQTETIADDIEGTFVQPLDRYSEEFIRGRILPQVEGRIFERLTDGQETHAEGISINIVSLDFQILSATQR